jgi:ATP/maltotriose-dependent transcriptional regulator MalT
LGHSLVNTGEMAGASGWFGRAQRLLDDGELDCVERGYLLMPQGIGAIFGGDAATAYSIFDQAGAIADRFGDGDLLAMTRMARGRALIRLGNMTEGLSFLDEAMVAITAGECTALVIGDVYCSVIEACHEIYDMRRAQEWTTALSRWCESQPDLVPYRGQCLVHRAQIMQLHGEWPDATEEGQRASERLTTPPPHPAAGEAFYLLGDLHRVRGQHAGAEDAYRQANQWGREPQPGLALLRRAQGQLDAATASIRRTLDEAQDRVDRPKLLNAYAEILLETGDTNAARVAADELAGIAADFDATLLHAMAADTVGRVLLAEGDARAALDQLRHAWTLWQDIDAPYESARVRVQIGLACRALGDEDTAEMELDAARWIFQQLGAAPDVARVQQLSHKSAKDTGGLTAREVEVLRCVASGKTNRSIATDLFLSEKTIDRHVSNILAKLGVPSRSAATAYAYEHDLV